MPETLGADPGNGISGVGTTLSGSAYMSGPAAGPIGMITKLAIDGQEAGEIDITTMNTAVADSFYRRFIAALVDAKGMTVSLLYERVNMTLVLALVGGKNQNWTVAFPDGSTLVVPGFVKRLSTQIPYDDKISQELMFRFSGKPIFNAASGA